MELFKVMESNPNEASGNGACLCSPIKSRDCKPPYVVFYNADMDDPRNPHAVACAGCICAAAEATKGEALGKTPPPTIPDVFEAFRATAKPIERQPTVRTDDGRDQVEIEVIPNLADQRVTEDEEVIDAEVVPDEELVI